MPPFKAAASAALFAIALLQGPGTARAGGIERAPQGLSALFQPGTYVELSWGHVMPRVSGRDLGGGGSSGNLPRAYDMPGLAIKTDLGRHLSFAFIVDQAFGADILYGPGSVRLAGTYARATSTDYTGVLRYRLDNGISAYGGLRLQQADGAIGLSGAAYGPLSGYRVRFDDDMATGYLLGMAYEKPKVGLRVSLTYNSAIRHDFPTVERVGSTVVATGSTPVKTPQSVNLDAQIGVSPTTLAFASIRWVNWSQFTIDPAFFYPRGGGLVAIRNTTTYTLGLAHRFDAHWTGVASLSVEPHRQEQVSPLAPTNGRYGIGLAAIYTQGRMTVTAGANYTVFGDALATTYAPQARFKGNHAVAFGVKIGWRF